VLLLFLYGSTGARLAVMGSEESFFSNLLLGCELLVYITAISYFIFRSEIFGNPNSLGAVMGVAAAPVLLWGILISGRPTTRWRRTFAFALALLLLFSSYARAGIAGAAASCILLCLASRRYGLLLRGAGVALALAAFVAAVVPLHQQPSDSLTSAFVYKGRREDGILASRRPIWDETVSAIQEHPWLGSGFGTSLTSMEIVQRPESFESLRQATREHGNSYLAITEWVGFVGDVPFFGLVILAAANVWRALVQMRRTKNVLSPAIPLAAVLAAGLVHAAFEDWLFAPGYYLCIFFWTLAFIMVDVLPVNALVPAPFAQRIPLPWTPRSGTVTLGR
jgi:O-antigen ligase